MYQRMIALKMIVHFLILGNFVGGQITTKSVCPGESGNEAGKSEAQCYLDQTKQLVDMIERQRQDMTTVIQEMNTLQAEMIKLKHLMPLTDCSSIPDKQGVFTIEARIPGIPTSVMQAYCDNGWLYIARRFNGTKDFYRTWDEYKKGFGSVRGEYFLGMENIVSVLKQPMNYKLRIELTTWNGELGYAEYLNFDIGNEANMYRLNIGGYQGNIGDSLQYHNDKPFSTHDHENIGNPLTDCAEQHHGAWWYNRCLNSNLFGRYASGGQCTTPSTCIYWDSWTANHPNDPGPNVQIKNYSFKIMNMMIKPI